MEAKMPPKLEIIKQYQKSLSFVCPDPLKIFNMNITPNINISVNVHATNINKDDNIYEIALAIGATADVNADDKSESLACFEIKLDFAAITKIVEKDMSEDAKKEILLAEVPRMIFPYARCIVSNVTMNAGFAPLMINPIDFYELHEKQKNTASKNDSAE